MKPQVAILMGSDSDFSTMERTTTVLKEFGVGFEIRVMSAHRTPEAVVAFVQAAPDRGIKVFIAAAGGAAHLAGAVAAQTILPVIGVPIASTELQGVDALYATVQMPPGIPVATVAIGKFGATNAALLAIQILATSDAGLQKKLKEYKVSIREKVEKADRDLQTKL
jgi:phosphoribosylaminoimidazole carboxylase PurE protein